MTRTCIGEARAEGLIATLPPSFLHSSSITTCCHVPYYPYCIVRAAIISRPRMPPN